MTYSCTDFVDTILDALKIVVPEEAQDDPSAQAALALDAIAGLKEDISALGVSLQNLLSDIEAVGAPTHTEDQGTSGAIDAANGVLHRLGFEMVNVNVRELKPTTAIP